ncbi:activated protein kinase catalytic subunit alpha-1 [Seminavis robusta]|uniref:guanylate cyclase n=1 Tax=Seminavis robusta TaxID=568900 RepID=A0A9N8HRG4_9STRA|nr:activated protein kinase catalytic subunit alpha-1 [Seminavis robusta]|eukprot:Sro1269_g257850.1 activated protein kinase catalytic subunit alpha-1 (1346) ;mRNA; f:4912-10003
MMCRPWTQFTLLVTLWTVMALQSTPTAGAEFEVHIPDVGLAAEEDVAVEPGPMEDEVPVTDMPEQVEEEPQHEYEDDQRWAGARKEWQDDMHLYTSNLNCTSGVNKFNPLVHKKKYTVAVHAIRGVDTAMNLYNFTMVEYLTRTAGQRFDPPIAFELVTTEMMDLYEMIEGQDVDFIYSNPGTYSCVGVEYGMQPLATVTSRQTVRGHTFDLDVFGGVIFTREDRDDINVIHDLKDKIIGAGGIARINAGPAQFHEMIKSGMDYVMDPKQVVFARDQFKVVQGVIDGKYDVGFVRTDQLERHTDENGEPVDTNIFKVINPKIYIMDDGNLFPFLHSTDIYPEWPLAALDHVDKTVSAEVQEAILAIGKHALIGQRLEECRAEYRNRGKDSSPCEQKSIPEDFDLEGTARCDTTKALAELSYKAALAGKFSGYRPPRSYFEPRTMQEAVGLLAKNHRGHWQCTRLDTLYDGVVCPEGHYKVSLEQFHEGCSQMGLFCEEGMDCWCKPCVMAFEVDVYPYDEQGNVTDHRITGDQNQEQIEACGKMTLCDTIEQTREAHFRAYDNRGRENPNVRVTMHVGEHDEELVVTRQNGTFAYDFDWRWDTVAVGIMEVYFDDVQIPQSPIRVQVVPRNCDMDAEHKGQGKVPGESGMCICGSGTVELGSKCVSSAVFFAILAAIILVIALQLGVWFLGYKKRQSDQMWLVNVEELHFSEPVEIIGQGAFGVVLLAEYRGTKVAIKRVIRPNDRLTHKRASSALTSADGSKEQSMEPSDTDQKSLESGLGDIESQDVGSSISDPVVSKSGTQSEEGDTLDFLGGFSVRKRGKLAKWFPWFCTEDQSRMKTNILLGNSVGDSSVHSKSLRSTLFPCTDRQHRKKQEFIVEMRLLSRLRHPCITTVMGAVISSAHEPMLVMEYMEYGSLYDILRNETMYAGGEIILQIVRDIAQGLRYLHSSRPPILHGDLKAKNILIDSRFRAKVADFGLSSGKKKSGISGTPYFMAPEYLRGKSEYTTQCDIYSFAIILYEIYARKDPYQGENRREVMRRVVDPRYNKRPEIPECCPPKMVDIMKKAWSPDPFFRPQAKDLDMMFMDMGMRDTDPLAAGENVRPERATGDMLYDLFPKHIADALKAGQKVEPENHDMVTVVFSDIVHFTDISRTISPVKVCNMLDRLYLVFDQLARQHHVFKVETIGDAYMGVTNLENNMKDTHVKHIAEFALAMVEAAGKILIDEDDPRRGFVRIRVGFHSGPVVSNVIGSLNPRYGLFGDTVNTASRMESNSTSRRVHCSEKSAQILKDQAPEIKLIKRGKIGVKGKGEMVTYWVGSSHKHDDCEEQPDEDGVPKVSFAEG